MFETAQRRAKVEEVTGRKTAGDAAHHKQNREFELKVNEKFRKVKETRETIMREEAEQRELQKRRYNSAMGFRTEEEEFEDNNKQMVGIGRTTDSLKQRLQSALKSRYSHNLKTIEERKVITYKLEEYD